VDQAKFEQLETVADGLETLRTLRSSLSTRGDGFVEAVDDATLVDLSKQQCKQSQGKICGLVLRVPILEYEIQWKGLSLAAYQATANRIRTAPLWGVRMRPALMHDGASLTFRDAVLRHQGEAKSVTARFEKLGQPDQDAIVEFLKSL
jgi:hypothetical protein